MFHNCNLLQQTAAESGRQRNFIFHARLVRPNERAAATVDRNGVHTHVPFDVREHVTRVGDGKGRLRLHVARLEPVGNLSFGQMPDFVLQLPQACEQTALAALLDGQRAIVL